MKPNSIAYLTATLTFVLGACGKGPDPEGKVPATAVARVGDTWIVEADLEAAQQSGMGADSVALERLITEETLAQNALRDGMGEDPSVKAAIRRVLASRYLEKHLSKPVEVSDEEVRRAFEESGDRYMEAASAHVAVLRQSFDKVNELDAWQDLENAQKAYRKLPAGESRRGFGSLAVSHSDQGDTRYQGGDCGWVEDGRGHVLLPSDVIAAALARKKTGLCDKIIVADGAAWLVLVLEKREAKRQPYESVAPRIRAQLIAEATKEARQRVDLDARKVIPSRILRQFPEGQLAAGMADDGLPQFP